MYEQSGFGKPGCKGYRHQERGAGSGRLCFCHDPITNTLKNKDQVTVVGFGTFKVSNRKARMGRNLRTGEAITIEARNVPKFTASKVLRDAVEETSDSSVQ